MLRIAPLKVAIARVEAAVEEVARQDLVLGGLAVVLWKSLLQSNLIDSEKHMVARASFT